MILLILWAVLAALSPTAATAQDEEIVVRGNARFEIERILGLDNLDTGRLSPRDVADTMDGIERGRAPSDFWQAYRAHVEAWRGLADATERARRMLSEPASLEPGEPSEVAKAKLATDTSFDEVERIAWLYGVEMPIPRARSIADN